MRKSEHKGILTKNKRPEKNLLLDLKKRNSGRGSDGRITVRHKGGGVKKLYRIIDFGQEKMGKKGKVIALEYDPYRTSFITLVEYEDNTKRYRIAPHDIKIGDEIICDEQVSLKTGNRTKIRHIPVGTMVYEVELEPSLGGKIVRSAGSGAKVLAQEGRFTNIQMPSGEVRKVLSECYASIGMVSFPEWRYVVIGKAGRSRLRGIRPSVRGTAMNPVDHPHGGGEGRQPIGLKYPKTPWGKHALGVKTRKKKWTDKYILSRRKKNK